MNLAVITYHNNDELKLFTISVPLRDLWLNRPSNGFFSPASEISGRLPHVIAFNVLPGKPYSDNLNPFQPLCCDSSDMSLT